MAHTFCGRSTGKFPGISGLLKSSPIFLLELSGGNACSIYEFSGM